MKARIVDNSSKLGFNGWFRYYKGLIYCNGVTEINYAIMNKENIDKIQPPKVSNKNMNLYNNL